MSDRAQMRSGRAQTLDGLGISALRLEKSSRFSLLLLFDPVLLRNALDEAPLAIDAVSIVDARGPLL
jgi:hypothetical protein